MSRNWVQDIVDMHEKFRFHEDLNFNGQFLRFRQRFVEEELKELDSAILSNNPEAVVDALIDICVVAIGTLDLADVDIHKAWDEVHEKNMAKQRANNPTRKDSGGFDLIKPEGWNPPNHAGNTGNVDHAIQEIIQQMDKTGIDRHGLPSHIKVLNEFIQHALNKTEDYDDEHDSEFQHSAYYPNGINDIVYELAKKIRRIRHIIKKIFEGEADRPLTDSLDDSFRDISIYAAIGYAYVQKRLEGQSEDRDIFNREMR